MSNLGNRSSKSDKTMYISTLVVSLILFFIFSSGGYGSISLLPVIFVLGWAFFDFMGDAKQK